MSDDLTAFFQPLNCNILGLGFELFIIQKIVLLAPLH